jgi:PAS domain S-box-containing protein
MPAGNVDFFRFVPITVGGSVQQAMLLVDDVTERHKLGVEVRRAERHLTGVVQSANDLLAYLDEEGHIVTWNPAAERVSGWTLAEARGRRLWELCEPDDAELMMKMLHGSPAEQQAHTHEARLVAPDGRESIVDWSSSPMTDDNGVITGTVVVGRDLTSYRLLASQLIQAEKMASLGVMAGGIAHELRTPAGRYPGQCPAAA